MSRPTGLSACVPRPGLFLAGPGPGLSLLSDLGCSLEVLGLGMRAGGAGALVCCGGSCHLVSYTD